MIVKAESKDCETVKRIASETISAVYPLYYPAGAVQFFLEHHSEERIAADIAAGAVWLYMYGESAAGTVTVNGNEINRLFVLPEYQGKVFGGELLRFAEGIAGAGGTITLSASLPAKAIYLSHGYRETEYHIIGTENGDKLCYDQMIKLV